MKNVTKFRGIVSNLRSLPANQNGHPRYQVSVVDGKKGRVFVTAPESPIAYKMSKYVGQRVIVRAGEHYGKLTVASIRRERSH